MPISRRSLLFAMATGKIRLIIQGDDMAATHAIDAGTIRAYKEGILRTANVIVPGPWLLHTAKLVNENPGLDIGVHLTLTSEWSYIKWRPITHVPSLVDANGYFYPFVFPSKTMPPGSALLDAKPKFEEVERELRAQIETARRLMPQISYLHMHMGFDSGRPEWRELVQNLAREHKLYITGGKEPEIQDLVRVWSNRPFDSGEVRAEKLAARLETLTPGLWRLKDHVSEDDPEMRAISHPGNDGVAADRSAILAAFTSPRVLEVVRKRGIELTSYRELAKR